MHKIIEIEKNLHIILKKESPSTLFFVNKKKEKEIEKKHEIDSEKNIKITIDLEENIETKIIFLNQSESNLTVHFHITLKEPHSKVEFKALMLPKQSERMEISLCMEHEAPDCESHTVCRGVVKDKALSFFTGKIVVKENAKNSIAKLENKNLLLSPDAFCHTEPQLEIYNDEVKCSHGATVGHLDADALFYLRSRGLSYEEAQKFLIQAFIAPIISEIPFMDSGIHGNNIESSEIFKNSLLDVA